MTSKLPAPHIVIIDGHNFMHRARAGFAQGEFSVVFNFFRNLRALIETLDASRVVFVLEGHPQARHDLLPEYKANRIIALENDGVTTVDPRQQKRHNDLVEFHRQKDLIVDLLKRAFPISVVRHPDLECDDVIYNIIKTSSASVPITVVSNDSDFTQLLNRFDHVLVYNPMSKTYVQTPDFDYVSWKALRGDGSDNIPGIPGVGDKTATKLVTDPDALRAFFDDPAHRAQFNRNFELISFHDWTDESRLKLESSERTCGWDAVEEAFQRWGFASILKPKSWEKFKATFAALERSE